MPTATNSPPWPLLDVDAMWRNGWLEDCNENEMEDTNMTYAESLEWANGYAYGMGNIRAYGYSAAERLYRIAYHGTSLNEAFKEGFAAALASVDVRTLRLDTDAALEAVQR